VSTPRRRRPSAPHGAGGPVAPPPEALAWIRRLGLEPHPEGGHYRETYRSSARIGACCLGAGFEGDRPVCTAIHYLLAGDDVSALHRIRSDEVWHFHAGAPLTLHLLEPGAGYRAVVLGCDPGRGHAPQAVVPAGLWFGATVGAPEVPPGASAYALVSCTVAPGFDFRDFELADRAALLREFGEVRHLIERLAR
jgi:hypothetical protein